MEFSILDTLQDQTIPKLLEKNSPSHFTKEVSCYRYLPKNLAPFCYSYKSTKTILSWKDINLFLPIGKISSRIGSYISQFGNHPICQVKYKPQSSGMSQEYFRKFNKIIFNLSSQIYGKKLSVNKQEAQTHFYKTFFVKCILYLLFHNCIPHWYWQETVYVVCPRTCLNQQEKSYYHSNKGKTVEEDSRFL